MAQALKNKYRTVAKKENYVLYSNLEAYRKIENNRCYTLLKSA